MYVPNTVIWDNIAVDLYVDNVFQASYESKTEALKDAVNLC